CVPCAPRWSPPRCDPSGVDGGHWRPAPARRTSVQADPRVVDLLNEVLTTELTAINQYFLNAKMCANWGYERLATLHRDISLDEMKDADPIIDRILYFEGLPNLQ